MSEGETQLSPEAHREKSILTDFVAYRGILFVHRWTVVSITALFFAGSMLFFASTPNYYTVESQILVERSRDSQRLYEQMVLPTFSGEDDYFGTQIAVLTGNKILSQIEQEFSLRADKFKLKVKRLPLSRVISVKVTYKDPAIAVKIANRIAELYVNAKEEDDLFLSKQMLRLLPKNVDQQLSPITSEGEPGTSDDSVDFLKSVTSDATLQKLNIQKLDSESRLREVAQRYKAKHPVMKEIVGTLDYLNLQIDDRKKKILENLKVSLAGQFQVTNTKVLMAAVPPLKPAGPPRVLGVLLSTLAGLIAGVYFSIFMELANQKIRDERDLPAGLSTVFFGSIPYVAKIKKNKKLGAKAKPGPAPTPSLVHAMNIETSLADAVAKIRTHIFYSVPYQKSKQIMVTSSLPHEGKTTAAALLALSITTMGRKVVIIDADLRRPVLHTYFDVPNQRGLVDYLHGQADAAEIARDIPGSDLKIITPGSVTSQPAELLSSPKLKELLDKLSEMFDRVIIDVPPAMYLPDAFIIAKYVHVAILVCGSNVVRKRAVKNVTDRFTQMGQPFAGLIINGVNFKQSIANYEYFSSYNSEYYKTPARKR